MNVLTFTSATGSQPSIVVTLTETQETWNGFIPQLVTVLETTPVNPNFVRAIQNTTNGVRVIAAGQYAAGIDQADLIKALVAINPLLSWPPWITTQPTPQSVVATNPATFTIVVDATELPNTYQWQESTDGSSTWNNLANAGIYSGVTTASLVVTPPTVTPYNGYQYRCVITNGAGTSTSNNVVLTVT